MARQNPAAKSAGRTGTWGNPRIVEQDPELKALYGQTAAETKAAKPDVMPGWMKQIGSAVSGMFGRKGAGRPASSHPAPAKPATTPEEADRIYNKYVK